MRSIKRLFIPLSLLFISLLAGCGSSETNASSKNTLGQDSPSIRLIASEKTLPDDFYQTAVQGVLAKKATSQEVFEQMWAEYGLRQTPPEINWQHDAVIFLGVVESGSCPYDVQSVHFEDDKTLLVLLHTEPDKPCTDDATPRTFVIAVDAQQAAKAERVVIENFGGLSPMVPLQTEE